MSELRAFLRVQALAEVGRRYGAVVLALSEAAAGALPEMEGEARERLEAALRDASAQLAALDDALDRATRDLT